MHVSKIVSTLAFVGALAIGIAVGSVADDRREIVSIVSIELSPLPPVVEYVPVRAEDLVGVWTGTWGYNRAHCTIEIDRIDRKKFYGTLTKEDAKIALVGTIDLNGRTISFRETKVISLGKYSTWSLGTNTGAFSADGRTLTGTGTDEWGMYGWDATKDRVVFRVSSF